MNTISFIFKFHNINELLLGGVHSFLVTSSTSSCAAANILLQIWNIFIVTCCGVKDQCWRCLACLYFDATGAITTEDKIQLRGWPLQLKWMDFLVTVGSNYFGISLALCYCGHCGGQLSLLIYWIKWENNKWERNIPRRVIAWVKIIISAGQVLSNCLVKKNRQTYFVWIPMEKGAMIFELEKWINVENRKWKMKMTCISSV